MAYSYIEIGQIDVSHCSTTPIDKERLKKDRSEIGDVPLFVLKLRHAGNPDVGDGPEIAVEYTNGSHGDKDLCVLHIDESSWKTFVEAVRALDIMRDAQDLT